jgi:AraC-like DNA-binding protein
MAAALTEEQPHAWVHRPTSSLWLGLTLGEIELQRTINGHTLHEVLDVNRIVLTPPGTACEDIIHNATTSFHLFIRPNVIAEVAEDLFETYPKDLEILPMFGGDDPGLAYLLRAAKRLVLDPVPNQKQHEYLARMVAAHVINRYAADAEVKPTHDASGLGPRQLRQVKEYIAQNLERPLVLKELASICGLSRTLFIARFRQSMRRSPHQFVMMMRVRRAEEMLLTTQFSLAEIAAACGFADQSHLAGVFKKFCGATPSQFRAETR